MTVSIEELALLTGLSIRKLRQLERKGIIVPVKNGEEEQSESEHEEEYNELVSAEELADIADVTPRWIRQLTQDGILTAVKVEGERGWFYYKLWAMLELLKYYREKHEGS